MIRMSDHAAEMCAKHCSDSMFFDRGEIVIEGTNENGARITVVVDGHKRFMLCNVVYEDEASPTTSTASQYGSTRPMSSTPTTT